MKLFLLSAIVATLSAVANAEVPQEHSHDRIVVAMRKCFQLAPGNLPDPIFGLLGQKKADANAPDGNGACLQQSLADVAITNALRMMSGEEQKQCIAAAIKFRALERNANLVGLATPMCDRQPVNVKFLGGLVQHQDPAATGATENNKFSEIETAKKLAALGVNPLEALETATFAPAELHANEERGNSCNENDCIFQDGRLKPIATEAEIREAVKSIVPEPLQGSSAAIPSVAAVHAPVQAAPVQAAPVQAAPAGSSPFPVVPVLAAATPCTTTRIVVVTVTRTAVAAPTEAAVAPQTAFVSAPSDIPAPVPSVILPAGSAPQPIPSEAAVLQAPASVPFVAPVAPAAGDSAPFPAPAVVPPGTANVAQAPSSAPFSPISPPTTQTVAVVLPPVAPVTGSYGPAQPQNAPVTGSYGPALPQPQSAPITAAGKTPCHGSTAFPPSPPLVPQQQRPLPVQMCRARKPSAL